MHITLILVNNDTMYSNIVIRIGEYKLVVINNGRKLMYLEYHRKML